LRAGAGSPSVVVDGIAGTPTMVKVPARALQLAADGIRAIQETTDKLFIDDGLWGRRLVSHFGKVVSFKKGEYPSP